MRGVRKLAGLDLIREAPAILVGEPTCNRIATEERGIYRVRVTRGGRLNRPARPQMF